MLYVIARRAARGAAISADHGTRLPPTPPAATTPEIATIVSNYNGLPPLPQ
ncbi:hypothetical protein [Chloroflexus sp.]|uniref:hypothetical protein n=1 Tax=Chloroflexus sp. TaxID=1904827 RepID=UPI00298EFCC1|nr:hypothetical protein [Chloroflexus sp.]MDW8403702.1 hypothetical protein [Chloroflexus sp.]